MRSLSPFVKLMVLPLLAALLAALTGAVLWPNLARADGPDAAGPPLELTRPGRSPTEANKSLPLSDLPALAQYRISEAIGADQARYQAGPPAEGWPMVNGPLTARFDEAGALFRAGPARWGLRPLQHGYEPHLQAGARRSPPGRRQPGHVCPQ